MKSVLLSATCLAAGLMAGCGSLDTAIDGATKSSLCSCDQFADDSKCIQFEPIGPTQSVADMNCSNFKMTCSAGGSGNATDSACQSSDLYATCTIEVAGTKTYKYWYTTGGKPHTASDDAELQSDCDNDNGTLTMN